MDTGAGTEWGRNKVLKSLNLPDWLNGPKGYPASKGGVPLSE